MATLLLNFDGKFRICLSFLGLGGCDTFAVLFVLFLAFACKAHHFAGMFRFLPVCLLLSSGLQRCDAIVLLCVELCEFRSVLALLLLSGKTFFFRRFLRRDSLLALLEFNGLLRSLLSFLRSPTLRRHCSHFVLTNGGYSSLFGCRKFLECVNGLLCATYGLI